MVGIGLSILQMPGGVPVATVALNGAKMPEFLPHKSLEVTTMRFRQNHFFYKEGLKQAVDKAASEL
jgi:5-(carboxyamino)imidazole ribonucleotide mutase